jgi:hypothetical protein
MQEIADGQWRAEALSVRLWALKQTQDIPAYDTQAPIASVMGLLPSPGSSVRFVSKAALRGENAILEARNVAELWLWLARTTQLQLTAGFKSGVVIVLGIHSHGAVGDWRT